MGLEELAVSMNRLGIHYTVLESGADGAVLILPEYGRVLGVWPHWRGENALWVNPDFLRMLEIGAKDDGWLNPGGDRIWLGPREEFFPHDTVPPPSLDPGRYEGAAEKGVFSMENKGEVHAWKSGTMLGFRIQRRLRSLEEQEILRRVGDSMAAAGRVRRGNHSGGFPSKFPPAYGSGTSRRFPGARRRSRPGALATEAPGRNRSRGRSSASTNTMTAEASSWSRHSRSRERVRTARVPVSRSTGNHPRPSHRGRG